jgi:hypothetical protein
MRWTVKRIPSEGVIGKRGTWKRWGVCMMGSRYRESMAAVNASRKSRVRSQGAPKVKERLKPAAAEEQAQTRAGAGTGVAFSASSS